MELLALRVIKNGFKLFFNGFKSNIHLPSDLLLPPSQPVQSQSLQPEGGKMGNGTDKHNILPVHWWL